MVKKLYDIIHLLGQNSLFLFLFDLIVIQPGDECSKGHSKMITLENISKGGDTLGRFSARLLLTLKAPVITIVVCFIFCRLL